MSTTEWTNPETGERYPIGYEGLEHSSTVMLDFMADIFRATYPMMPITSALATMVLDWDGNSVVPTYGKWAGPGWGGGKRTSSVDWTELPGKKGSSLCLAHVRKILDTGLRRYDIMKEVLEQ